MRGRHHIVVQNNIVQFKFDLYRNITILRGDSATGKSTLVDMVRQYALNGASSGVNISSDKTCTVLTGLRWQDEIKSIQDSIVFIDEGFEFISGVEFARAIRQSDNYYVIATRESLFNLPYSIKEVYRIRNVARRSKYQQYDRIYSEFYPLYDDKVVFTKPDIVIVEDTNSAFEFFKAVCGKEGIQCVSAEGKSGIYGKIKENSNKISLVIADGAAFGPELERVLSLRKAASTVLFLPESFEWLVLRSGIVDDREIKEILEHPYDFVESNVYFSWERFFTALLTDKTHGSYLQYSKKKLNPNYLHGTELNEICDTIKRDIPGTKKNEF